VTDASGREVTDSRGMGYRYFGAAKALPGVKELFDRAPPKAVRRTRAQLYRAIDPDYYGFRDEEDGALEAAEPAAERATRAAALAEWEAREAERAAGAAAAGASGSRAAGGEAADGEAPQFVAYVPLPDSAAIEARVLERKKRDLLAKYASDSLLLQQEEAKALLNKR